MIMNVVLAILEVDQDNFALKLKKEQYPLDKMEMVTLAQDVITHKSSAKKIIGQTE